MRRLLSAAALALLTVGCVDKPLLTGAASGVTLHLALASQTAETRSVKVNVRYDRTNGERVALTEQVFNVTTASKPQVAVAVDLAACLGDATHAGGTGACQLRAAIALRNGAGTLLDSVEVGPVSAAPGTAPAPTTVSLAVAAVVGISGLPPSGVKLGETLPLIAKVNDAAGNAITGRSVTWTSSNPAVASVDGAGMLKGVGLGTATITASVGGAQATQPVLVRALRVDFVRILPLEITARYGFPQQLATRVVGDSGVLATVSWVAEDPSLLSVDAQGILTVLRDDEKALSPVCAVAKVAATGATTTSCTLVRLVAPTSGTLRLQNGTVLTIPSPVVDTALSINHIVDAVTRAPVDLATLDSGRVIEVGSYKVLGAESGGTFALSSSDTTVIASDPGGFKLRVKRRSPNPVLVCATASALPGHRTCLTLVVQGVGPVRIEGITSYVRTAAPDSGQFAVFITAPAGASTAATYRSSDPTKVSVTNTGIVRMLTPTTGTTVCANAVADTTRKACATIVADAAVQGINIQASHDAGGTSLIAQRSILGGASVYFRGTIVGGAGVDQRLRWSSSDATALLIDPATGVAKSLKSGAETFACGWSVGDWSLALCMGLYMRNPSVVFAAVYPNRTGMMVGETRTISVAWAEDAPANAQVTWSVGDATALAISASGARTATITALRPTPGTVVCATVSKAAAPSYRDCGTVRVVDTPLASASADTLGTLTFVGDLAFNSTVTELGAVRPNIELVIGWAVRGVSNPTVAFRSSDPSAVSIGAQTLFSANSGLVRITPLKTGTFPVICGELVGAPQQRDCLTLTISGDANMRLRVAPSWAELAVGERVNMTASVDALRGEATTVQWTSSDPSKLTVSSSGVVTAVALTAGTQVCALTTAYTPGRRACATFVVK